MHYTLYLQISPTVTSKIAPESLTFLFLFIESCGEEVKERVTHYKEGRREMKRKLRHKPKLRTHTHAHVRAHTHTHTHTHIHVMIQSVWSYSKLQRF